MVLHLLRYKYRQSSKAPELDGPECDGKELSGDELPLAYLGQQLLQNLKRVPRVDLECEPAVYDLVEARYVSTLYSNYHQTTHSLCAIWIRLVHRRILVREDRKDMKAVYFARSRVEASAVTVKHIAHYIERPAHA